MKQRIAHIALLVPDYDRAIAFFTQKLNFDLIEDTVLSPEKRWVLVAPKGTSGFSLLLAKASNQIQKDSIGNQSGGRVFLFLETDDFERDYHNLLQQHITIVREPITESYGKVAVFADEFGNFWDLIERTAN